MASSKAAPTSAETGRPQRHGKWSGRLWSTAGLFLVAYNFLVLAAILFRHPWRIDFTEEGENRLTPAALKQLELVREPIRVIVPLFFQNDDPLARIQARVLLRGRDFLREFCARQPRLRIEAQLNLAVAADVEEWKRLSKEYSLSALQLNRLIFLAGSKGEHKVVVGPDDLAIYDRPQSVHDARPPQIREFRGERAITTALARLASRDKKRIVFLEDHRESPLGDSSLLGLSQLRAELEAMGFEIAFHALSTEESFPRGTDLVVSAGPRAPFSEEDRRKLSLYLQDGGRLLVLLSPDETGLEPLLDSWGIRCGSGRLSRLERFAGGGGIVRRFGFNVEEAQREHPITRDFGVLSWSFLVTGCRAVGAARSQLMTSEWLLRTGPNRLVFVDRNNDGRPQEGEEERAVSIAAAAWQRVPDRAPPEFRANPVRVVVVGDVSPFTNQWIAQHSHLDFLLNTVHWLASEEERITSPSAGLKNRQLAWTPHIELFLFWVPVVLFPGLVLAAGGLVYFLRRA